MVKDLCFEILDKCSNNCRFCSSNSDMSKATVISFNDFKRVIDHFMKTGGIGELSLSGGEPFLHPELEKMVAYSTGLGIKTVIFTSGVKVREPLSMDERRKIIVEEKRRLASVDSDDIRTISAIGKFYEKLLNPPIFSCIERESLERYKRMGLSKIVFDMQGYVQETDTYLMGRRSYSQQALFRSLLNASLVGLDVDVHFIPMKVNYKEIREILELLELASVKNISLLNFVPQGRGLENRESLELNETEKDEFFEILGSALDEGLYTGKVRIGIPLQGEEAHKCNAGLEKLDIKYDGTVLPCPAFKELSACEYKKYGIQVYSIYDDLDKIKIPGVGTRSEALCKKVYQMKDSGSND